MSYPNYAFRFGVSTETLRTAIHRLDDLLAKTGLPSDIQPALAGLRDYLLSQRKALISPIAMVEWREPEG